MAKNEGDRDLSAGDSPDERANEKANEDLTEGLVTRAQAAKRLHVSYATIARREANGELVATKIKGVNYFRAADLDQYEDLEADDDVSSAGAAALLRASKDIIREQMHHNAAILDMSAKVAFQLLELQSQTTVAQRERISTLEHERETLRQKIDDAAATQHDRDLELLREEARLKMQSDGFNLLKAHAPQLLAPIVAKLASLGGAAPAGAAALELAASLTEEQVVAICKLDILTPAQLSAIATIATMRSAAAAGTNGAPATGSNGAPPVT